MQTAGCTGVCRVVIADDNPTFRSVLRHLVEKSYQVVAEAEDGQAAVELAEEFLPDLILLDISMPFLSGFEAAQCILNRLPEVRIIFVSSYADPSYVEKAFQIGARGYVFKGSERHQLHRALEAVIEGRIFRPCLS